MLWRQSIRCFLLLFFLLSVFLCSFSLFTTSYLHLPVFFFFSPNPPPTTSTQLPLESPPLLLPFFPSSFHQKGQGVGPYKRLVFVVIDGLRSDLIFYQKKGDQGEAMPFLHSCLRNGNGVAFTARTSSPTVTMPRVKAIVTGQNPKFVDSLFNFHSRRLMEDNIISQLHKAGKEIHMFGDDTWLSLFGGEEGEEPIFSVSEGTTSFFVSDTVEVDLNVTRNIRQALHGSSARTSWDVLIAHYLGLDHIGHLAGPSDPRMPLKLTEMDSIIREIYFKIMFQTIEEKGEKGPWGGGDVGEGEERWLSDSLLVVVSDHGMTWKGGHGGATEEETAAFVAFLTPNIVPLGGGGKKGPCFFSEELMEGLSGCSFEGNWREEKEKGKEGLEEVQQVDVAPTISALMGIPPPRGGEGRVLVQALGGRQLGQVVRGLGRNANQLYMKLVEEGKEVREILEEEWEEGVQVCEECMECLERGRSCRGICEQGIKRVENLVGLLLEMEGGGGEGGDREHIVGMVGGMIGIGCCIGASWHYSSQFLLPLLSSNSFLSFFSFPLFHIFTLFSSSLIEEEHQTVYFFTTTTLLFLLGRSLFFSHSHRSNILPSFLLLVIHSLSRRWNHCGVKILEIVGGGGEEVEGWGDSTLTDSGIFSSALQSLPSSPSFSFLPIGGVEGGLVVVCGVFCILFFLFFLVLLRNEARERKRREEKLVGRERILSIESLGKREKMFTVFLLFLAVALLTIYHTLQEGKSQTVDMGGGDVISVVTAARFVYLILFVCLLWGVVLARRHGRGIWVGWLRLVLTLLLFLLHRPWNLPLLALLFVQTSLFVVLVRHLLLSHFSDFLSTSSLLSILSLFFWLSHSSYFYFGVSNSLSSIDFVGSFAGLSSFSYFLNPLLSFLILFSGPLLFLSSLLELVFLFEPPSLSKKEETGGRSRNFQGGKDVVVCVAWGGIVRRFCYCLCVCVVMVVFQDHLFCWSVFAPKLVFEWFWVIFDCLSFVVIGCFW